MSKLFCIVLAIAMLFALGGCDEVPAGAGNSTEPAYTNSTDPAGTATDPADTGTMASAGATEPGETVSAGPGDTSSATGTPEGSASPAPTATPSGKGTLSVGEVIGKAKVSEYLTLRKTMSAEGESLAQIPKDGTFTVLQVETGKKWLKVKYEDKTGFVQFKFVTVGDGDDDRVCTVFCNSVLNVRDGAGTNNDVIGSVEPGTNLIVQGKTTAGGKTWYKVAVGSATGYVIAQYCRIAER